MRELALPDNGSNLIGAVTNPASEAHFRALEAAAFTYASASALAPVEDTTLPDSDFLAEGSDHVAHFLDAFGVTGEDEARPHLVFRVCISLISYSSHHNSRAQSRYTVLFVVTV